jgi:RNA polymerase sigma-70 factor (ECF subfamily)
MQINDREIKIKEYALAFQQGDDKALAFFYKEFYPALSFFANKWLEDRQVSEEIASEAFVKTWRKRDKLDSYGAIRAYLYKIVRRDCWKVQQRKKPIPIELTENIISTDNETAFDRIVEAEVARLISSALDELPPGSRKILSMYYLDGKSTGKIAHELNLHPSTVKTQKKNGLEAMRKILKRPFILITNLLNQWHYKIIPCH